MTTFDCREGCNRTLPAWMDTGDSVCTECAADTTTGSHRSELRTRDRRSAADASSTERDSLHEVPVSEFPRRTPPDGRSGSGDGSLPTDPSTQFYLEPDAPAELGETPDCFVFALGWYDPDDWRNDDYSRAILSLSKRDDEDAVPAFASGLEAFFDQRAVAAVAPDVVTAYPGHAGGVGDATAAVLRRVAEGRRFEYEQTLVRAESRPRQREQDVDSRWTNQRDSVAVRGDVSGETVLLFDDIVTSGASVTHGTKSLLDEGAELVVCICLGLTRDRRGELVRHLRTDTHTIVSAMRGN